MNDEFPGPVGIHSFLKQVAAICVSQDKAVRWLSPSGFLISSEYRESNWKEVRSPIWGGGNFEELPLVLPRGEGSAVKCGDFSGQLDKKKMVNALAPNFIHSLDAAVLHKGIMSVSKEVPLFTIHDCVYFAAGHSQDVLPHFRRSFHEVVTANPLRALVEYNGLNLELPPVGDADVDQCLDSPYLFS